MRLFFERFSQGTPNIGAKIEHYLFMTMKSDESQNLSLSFYLENGIERSLPLQEWTEKVRLQIYEVLRLVSGVALFAEDHYARLVSSCNLLNVPLAVSREDFLFQIERLGELNRRREGNVKVELLVGEFGQQHFRMFFIPHSYPALSAYEQGVTLGLMEAMRDNPQAKVAQSAVRERANQLIAENEWYEVLLIDADGCITEGSRSNVFFIRNGIFYTSPLTKVLGGITRKKVLDCIHALGMSCLEEDIRQSELDRFDAVFISGTSPKVLPVARIEGCVYDVDNASLRTLMHNFDQMLNSYIQQRKS